MAVGNQYPVAAPTRRPAVGGLLDAAVPTSPTVTVVREGREDSVADESWVSGVAFEPSQCEAAQVRDPCSSDPYDDLTDVCVDAVTFLPYEIVGEYRHSTFGLSARDPWAIARENLDICASAQIESELWADVTGQGNPALHDASGLQLLGGPYSATDALKRAIGAIGDCGCGFQHFIHATPRVTAEWFDDAAPLVYRQGRTFYTFNDHVVVSGAGYPGTGPDGADDSPDEWVFVSGPVDVRLGPYHDIGRQDGAGPISVRENVGVFRTMRYALASFDPSCCRMAIQVEIAPNES